MFCDKISLECKAIKKDNIYFVDNSHPSIFGYKLSMILLEIKKSIISSQWNKFKKYNLIFLLVRIVISWTIVSIIISFFVIRFIFISLADIDPFEYFRF